VNSLRKNRLAALFASLLLLCAFIASCENVSLLEDASSGTYSDGVSDTTSVDVESLLKYIGGEITIAVPESQQLAFSTNPNTDDIIGLTSMARNDLLAEKCGLELKIKTVSAENVLTELDAAQKAGLNYADILCLPAKTLSALADGEYLFNLLSSPDFKLDSNYINTTAAKEMAGNKTLYMLFDNATLFYDETWVVFYDKQLVSGTGLADPAKLAASGQWTWDEFIKYSEAVAQKVMSKGSPDTATDVFGFSSYNNTADLPLAIWESCGIPLFGETYGGPVTLKADAAVLKNSAKELQNIYFHKSRFPLQGEEAAAAFKKGRMGFFIYKLGFSAALVETGRDWGILPLPKYSADQNGYRSYVDPNAYAFAIPANAANPQRSILALNMLCAASKDTMRKAVYDKYVNLYFTNNAATVMLNTIMDSVYFDFAAIHASGMPAIANVSTNVVIDAVSKKGSDFSFTNEALSAFEKYASEKFK